MLALRGTIPRIVESFFWIRRHIHVFLIFSPFCAPHRSWSPCNAVSARQVISYDMPSFTCNCLAGGGDRSCPQLTKTCPGVSGSNHMYERAPKTPRLVAILARRNQAGLTNEAHCFRSRLIEKEFSPQIVASRALSWYCLICFSSVYRRQDPRMGPFWGPRPPERGL